MQLLLIAPFWDRSPYSSRIAKILTWCLRVEERCRAGPTSDWYKPLAWRICEVGFSNTCLGRLDNHTSHSSSNYVMNLVDAVCQALYKYQRSVAFPLGRGYSLTQYVIYNCFEPPQAILGELSSRDLAMDILGTVVDSLAIRQGEAMMSSGNMTIGWGGKSVRATRPGILHMQRTRCGTPRRCRSGSGSSSRLSRMKGRDCSESGIKRYSRRRNG